MKTERRQMRMHPAMLWDAIQKQAGSEAKAILEGVMNSIDAGATECRIEVDREKFTIKDDGRGFQGRSEIENFFETFGFPHVEGDATYGRYRMGRGQMFSYGANTWASREFRMAVDLKPQQGNPTHEIGWDLTVSDEIVEGCEIEVRLYEPFSPSNLDATIRQIKQYVALAQIPVYLNGKVISQHPDTMEWDEVTDDAYIKVSNSGSLSIYNMGALVCTVASWQHGIGGIVASKTKLDVNMARNDVSSTCPVWRRIKKRLDARLGEKVDRQRPLSDHERQALLTKLASGALEYSDVSDSRIITDITRSHHPVSRLENLSTWKNIVTIAPVGDRLGETVHTRRLGFVVTTECAGMLGAENPKELADIINGLVRHANVVPRDMDHFAQQIDDRHIALKDSELKPAERAVLKAIRAAADYMHWYGTFHDRDQQVFATDERSSKRRISVGVSNVAQGWTNGETDIWLERKTLKWASDGYKGLARIGALVLHEYLHEGPSTGTHEHGVEFYERFHDLTLYTPVIGNFVTEAMRNLAKEYRKDDKTLPGWLAKLEDGVDLGDRMGMDNAAEPMREIEEAREDASEPEVSMPMAASVPPSIVAPTKASRRRKERVVENAPRLPGM